MIFKDFDDAVACKDKGEVVVRVDDENGETIGYEPFTLDRFRETVLDKEGYLKEDREYYDGIGVETLKELVHWDKPKPMENDDLWRK